MSGDWLAPLLDQFLNPPQSMVDQVMEEMAMLGNTVSPIVAKSEARTRIAATIRQRIDCDRKALVRSFTEVMGVTYWSIRRLASGYWEVVPPSGVPIQRGYCTVSGGRGFTQDDAYCIAKFGIHLTERHADPLQICQRCRDEVRVGVYDVDGHPWKPPLEEVMGISLDLDDNGNDLPPDDEPDFTEDEDDPTTPGFKP